MFGASPATAIVGCSAQEASTPGGVKSGSKGCLRTSKTDVPSHPSANAASDRMFPLVACSRQDHLPGKKGFCVAPCRLHPSQSSQAAKHFRIEPVLRLLARIMLHEEADFSFHDRGG